MRGLPLALAPNSAGRGGPTPVPHLHPHLDRSGSGIPTTTVFYFNLEI